MWRAIRHPRACIASLHNPCQTKVHPSSEHYHLGRWVQLIRAHFTPVCANYVPPPSSPSRKRTEPRAGAAQVTESIAAIVCLANKESRYFAIRLEGDVHVGT